MNDPGTDMRRGALSRRLFLGVSGLAALLTLVPDVLMGASSRQRSPAAPAALADRAPVLAVFMNRLYLDVTGEDTPYEPPTERVGPQGDYDYSHHFLY
jgi:hypothetical protein